MSVLATLISPPLPIASKKADNAPLASVPRRIFGYLNRTWEGLFGCLSLILGLALLATFPIVNLLSLGYMLEVSARVARTGRLRDGFVGVRKAARLGSVVLGVWLLSWPLWYVSEVWKSSRLIDPDSKATRGWHFALVLLSALIVAHIISALLRGGKLRYFFWPRPGHFPRMIFRKATYATGRDALWIFLIGLRLSHYFMLGLRGFLGALLWLVVPITLLASASQLQPGPAVLMGGLGALLLGYVLLHLPFLQTRLALENRWQAMFDTRANRRLFRQAPLAFFFAILFTLAFALPLYLFKIEIIPREAAWLPSLLFVMSIFPARLFTGWAYSRGLCQTVPRHWFWRTLSRVALLPVVMFYVLVVYVTQYLSWYGVASLYEQHAFLVPVPFLGM